MKSYESKAALNEAIKTNYKKYIDEFTNIPNSLSNKRIQNVARTPSENISYQLGWITALLNWEKDEIAGQDVFVPAKGYTWNNLGGLINHFMMIMLTFLLKNRSTY